MYGFATLKRQKGVFKKKYDASLREVRGRFEERFPGRSFPESTARDYPIRDCIDDKPCTWERPKKGDLEEVFSQSDSEEEGHDLVHTDRKRGPPADEPDPNDTI